MKPFDQQTYYELLEVPAEASTDEIRAAYERARRLYAEDSVALYGLADPDEARRLRARLLEAVELLTDPDLRGEYDRSLGLPERQRREPEADTRQLAMTELLAGAEAQSTQPRYSFSYVPPPPAPPDPRPEVVVAAPAAEASATTSTSPASEGQASPPVGPAAPTVQPRSASPSPGPSRPAGPDLEIAPLLAQEAAIGIAEAALAQVSAQVRARERPPPPPRPEHRPKPVEIPHDAEINGELLRQVRESRTTSLAQLAERTRIGVRHLENIEADRYDALPATVYLRGILMSMARELGLDPLRVSKSYLGLVARQKK